MTIARRPKGRHYIWSMAAMSAIALARLSAQQQQRADVRPQATLTAQSYPAEQVQAGQTAFASRCGFCHGRDAAGGESGPDLTRSVLVAEDVRGDKIGSLVRAGRPDRGMPAFTLPDADLAAIVAFIHDQKTKAESQEGGRRSVDASDLQTGDAAAGRRFFEGAGGCTKCHSATGDLAGVGARLQGLTLLQRMLYPAPRPGRPVRARATVTLPSGEIIAGTLVSRDEFSIAIVDASSQYRSWNTATVKAVVDDPLDTHARLLDVYTDDQIHDVFAYVRSLRDGRRSEAAVTPPHPKGVDAATLLHPPADSWPTYHGDYSGRRHSALTQVTPENVRQLTLAWAFETGQSGQIKATPILVDGVIYLAMPDSAWAIDARTGRQIWRYSYPANEGFHIGHRGVAVRGNSVFLTTPDAHLVSLDATTGTVNWNIAVADSKRGYWSTMAPLVVRDHLLVGVSGDFDNLPGMLKSIDPESGKTQWTFYSTPPPGPPGTPDSKSGGATGGQMWMTGTYDPDLNLVFVGTGNPTPTLNGPARPGDNPWTCSILAINPDSGQLAWGFQASPHDTHDWDAAEVPVIVDAMFGGAPRKLLLQASRNGYFFVLDRTTGKNLLTKGFATVNWASGIDKDGRPTPAVAKEPARDGRLVAPNESGATNFRSPSFDPPTGLLVVSAQDGYGIYFFKPEHGAFGWAGADYTLYGKSAIRAIDYHTGAIKWNHEIGDGAGAAGVLTTESGVTFTGDIAGNLLALRTADGVTLWHASIGRIGNSPISYSLDGRQYIVSGGGGALYAWTLPAR